MSNAKYTKGPWTVSDSRNTLGFNPEESDHNFQVCDSRDYWIANVNKGIVGDEANAKLIAASTELLEDTITDLATIDHLIVSIKSGKIDHAIEVLEYNRKTKSELINKATQ